MCDSKTYPQDTFDQLHAFQLHVSPADDLSGLFDRVTNVLGSVAHKNKSTDNKIAIQAPEATAHSDMQREDGSFKMSATSAKTEEHCEGWSFKRTATATESEKQYSSTRHGDDQYLSYETKAQPDEQDEDWGFGRTTNVETLEEAEEQCSAPRHGNDDQSAPTRHADSSATNLISQILFAASVYEEQDEDWGFGRTANVETFEESEEQCSTHRNGNDDQSPTRHVDSSTTNLISQILFAASVYEGKTSDGTCK